MSKRTEKNGLLGAVESFECSLAVEHLSEASFLYEQRLSLFDDPEITWLDIDDFEQRMEAHLDGLFAGDQVGLTVCKQQATEGDFGELHAAVRVFCRQNRRDLVKEVLEVLDFGDEQRVRAVVDALNHDLPASWYDDLVQILLGENKKLIPIAAEVIGFRRLPAGIPLLKALQTSKTQLVSTVIWALGRIREHGARSFLLKVIDHEDESICHASALALQRLGDPQAILESARHAQEQEWPLILIGLGGGGAAAVALRQAVEKGPVSAPLLIALGLLGDVSVIDNLIACLKHEELAESAALALNLITGAEMYEDAFIPDEIDEDELFEEEIEKLENGEALYAPGEEPGATFSRVSQNWNVWQQWWEERKPFFSPNLRYRNGMPYAPACLLDNLQSERSPRLVRQLAYEELVIRYDIDFPFETDMLVLDQKKAIARYADWVKANNSRFKEGAWYFAGQVMP